MIIFIVLYFYNDFDFEIFLFPGIVLLGGGCFFRSG